MCDKNLMYCRCVKIRKVPEMTQDCHSLAHIHCTKNYLPPPSSKSQHYYWFIACFFEYTAKWRWGVLRFATFSHRLPPTLDSPRHLHTPSASDDCLGLPLSLALALYFLWWCTNKIQEEDNHKQKDDRDNGWTSLPSFWVFLCMYRTIIHKKGSSVASQIAPFVCYKF